MQFKRHDKEKVKERRASFAYGKEVYFFTPNT